MTREITSHKVNGCNDALRITAEGPLGVGGESRDYFVLKVALTYLDLAMESLHHRTKMREARGVEGTHTP